MPPELPPEPWLTLLREIDRAATAPLHLHCIGGFALSVVYESPRSTVDLDILVTVLDRNAAAALMPARQGSALHRRLGVYVHEVAVVTPPCEYESRLDEYCAGVFERIHLWIPDPYDLALLKLERNSTRDREDVRWLARLSGFDPNELRRRFHEGAARIPDRAGGVARPNPASLDRDDRGGPRLFHGRIGSGGR
ncbi:MAG TPA: DUF6036 family nucleotidyltransferase [Terriglobales bacterium]|nr:DUF6036 family nucleotidyltransferase [Terriglobales bacterium]